MVLRPAFQGPEFGIFPAAIAITRWKRRKPWPRKAGFKIIFEPLQEKPVRTRRPFVGLFFNNVGKPLPCFLTGE
jgi:hypothetical protein